MTFFNKKEDVIQIELTPYGRNMLSQGKLKPSYYAFFDDEVLYDATAGGFTETQSQIKTRILQETPSLRPTRCLESPENLISVSDRTQAESYPHVSMNLNYLTEPLGTSEGTSDYGPSWKSTFLKGEISGNVDLTLRGAQRSGSATVNTSGFFPIPGYDIGSEQYMKFIPQINSTIEYNMSVENVRNNTPVRGQQVSPSLPETPIFADGTYIKIIEEQLLCQLLETEGFLFKDGLEVEIYIYDDDESNIMKCVIN